MIDVNVLQVIQDYYPSETPGGPVVSMHASCGELARQGVHVHVATTNLDGRAGAWLNVPTNRAIELSKNYTVHYYKGLKRVHWSWPWMLNLRSEIQRADLVHLQDVFSIYAALTLILARMAGKPLLISARGVFSAWAMGSGKRWLKRLWINLLFRPLTQKNAKVAWHATSQGERDDILRLFPKAACHVVANASGVNLGVHPASASRSGYFKEFAADIDAGENEGNILVCLGRIHRIKGYDVAINAVAILESQVPDLVLIIAGTDGGEEVELRKLVEKLGQQNRVVFAGQVAEAAKARLLKGADVLLCPSHSENFGMSVLEALTVGTPVVASTGTPWQELNETQSGKWVENRPETFASAIIDVLANRQSMAINALALASRYGLPAQAKSFRTIYSGLLAGKSG